MNANKFTRIIAGIIGLCLIFSMLAFDWREAWTSKQEQAHQIAEIAREMGLEETDPIIVRAKELWWEDYEVMLDNGETDISEAAPVEEVETIEEPIAEPDISEQVAEEPIPWYTQTDIDIIASVVYNEAGYGTTMRHKELVAAVVVNRVMDSRFPNSVYEVVVQPYQYYAPYAQYGSYYMNRAMQSDIWQDCCAIAERALKGEIECPSNVIFQANFPQGYGTYELGYTSYSVSYFCYG